MITVEKLCLCGGRLYRKAKDETEARELINEFYRNHTGREPNGTVHKMLKPYEYWPMMKRRREKERQEAEREAERIKREQAQAKNTRRYVIKR
jgi:hypothetical protein